MRSLAGAEFVGIWLWNGEERVVELAASAGTGAADERRVRFGEGRVGRVAAAGRPRRFAIAPAGFRRGGPEAAESARSAAVAGLPLRVADRLIGVLAISTGEPLGAALGVLRAVADVLASAIDHRQTEEALRRSESRLAEAQQVARIGSFEWDLVGKRMLWSDQLYRLLGVSRGQLEPSLAGFLERVHPADREDFGRRVERHLARGGFAENTFRVIWPDGSVRYLHARGLVVRDAEGRALRMVGTNQDVTERKLVEAQAREAESRFRGLFESLPIGVVRTSIDGTPLAANPALVAMLGYDDLQQLLAAESGSLYVDSPERQRIAQRVVEQRAILGDELPLRRTDGSVVWARANLRLLVDAADRPVGIEGTLEDVTARRDVEAALRKRDEQFRMLTEAIPEIFWLWDPSAPEGWYVSPAAERIFGYSRAECMKNSQIHLECIHPDDQPRVLPVLLGSFRRGYDVEYRIVRADGEVRWVRSRSFPETGSSGELLHIAGFTEDVTERRAAEQALRESETKLRVALQGVPITVFVQDRALRYTWFHDARGEIDPQRIVGKRSGDLFAPQEAEELSRLGRRVIETGLGTRAEIGLTTDGTKRFYDLTLEPLRDPRGAPAGVAGAAFDVSERRAMEAELVQARDAALEASRLKSAILDNMSHEIRNPLNSIIGFAGLLAEPRQPPGPPPQEFVDSIQRASRRLLATVQAILDLSRLESGSFEVRPQAVDVRRVISEEAQALRRDAAAKGLTLECRLGSRRPVVLFDEYCLRGALAHLIDNAIKFTAQGSVVITLETEDRADVMIEVADTGVGIASDYLPRAFEAFSQEESGHGRRFDGTGLGLALTRSYLERNGARIEVESEKGKGTRFRIAIPFAARAPTAAEAGR
ncbi:MAG: PAS domain S-box protein [Deltaproteobacteria bacterium]|nr:PAS domain S-box protein [Deltaproteobacteria bacterium]